MPAQHSLQIFLCHALEDRDFVLEFEKGLSPLVKSGRVIVVGPHCLLAGDESADHLRLLLGSQVILLFLSPDFSRCGLEDMTRAVQQHKAGAAIVRAILLRPTPFLSLLPVSELPDAPLRPVDKSVAEWVPRDRAWELVTEALADAILPPASPAPPELRRKGMPFDAGHMFGLAMLKPYVLKCDRYEQWGKALTLLADAHSCVMVLPGHVGQAHTYFQQRIARLLPIDPPRRIIDVDWTGGSFPSTELEYRDALAQAIGLPHADDLLPELRKILCHRDLIILHRAVERDFERDDHAPSLVAYYTKWLPRLLQEVRGQRTVKFVQPIAWPMVSAWRRALYRELGRILPRWVAAWLCLGKTGYAAQRWIERLLAAPHQDLPVHLLSELEDIDERLLQGYCELMHIAAERRAAFISEIIEDTVTTEDRFRAIAYRLDKYSHVPMEALDGR